MKNIIKDKKTDVTNKQLFDFFSKEAAIEKAKNESRKKVMRFQLNKVTGGKNIVVLNYK